MFIYFCCAECACAIYLPALLFFFFEEHFVKCQLATPSGMCDLFVYSLY